jgi:hypothetical protein
MYRLKLLGDIQLTDPAGTIAMPGRKLKAFIAYLALNGNSALPREHLAAMFWPVGSTQQTPQNLRRMLARAKALFGADASEIITTEPESIMLATTWLAVRAAGLSPNSVLEIAAGTGVVTRAVVPILGPDSRYTVADLNQPLPIAWARPCATRSRRVMAPGLTWSRTLPPRP